jgi:hypothetical protein
MSDIERHFIMTDGAGSGCDDVAEICPNGLFGSHKFEARYDLGPTDLSPFQSIRGLFAARFAEAMRSKTYVRDVCVKCGMTIERVKA